MPTRVSTGCDVVIDHPTGEGRAAAPLDVRTADTLADVLWFVGCVHMRDAVAVELVGAVGVGEEVVEGVKDSSHLYLQFDD